MLEHPAYSLAWARFGLPAPVRYGWARNFERPGYATAVSQVVYGHAARKVTWLYYVGGAPPTMRWRDSHGLAVIGGGIHSGQCVGRPKLGKREASATPAAFRDVLLAIARSAAKVSA